MFLPHSLNFCSMIFSYLVFDPAYVDRRRNFTSQFSQLLSHQLSLAFHRIHVTFYPILILHNAILHQLYLASRSFV